MEIVMAGVTGLDEVVHMKGVVVEDMDEVMHMEEVVMENMDGAGKCDVVFEIGR